MAISSLEIYDEGQSQGFWKRIGIDTPAYVGDSLIRVVSVADMVTKVLNVIGKQREGIDLFIKGLGDVNYQSIGAGAMQDSSKEHSLQVDSTGELNSAGKIWLPRLIGRVSGIHLLGLDETSNSNANYQLLLAVAKVLTRVKVYAQIGTVVVNFGESEKHPATLRTAAERQRLRESLKKLDRR